MLIEVDVDNYEVTRIMGKECGNLKLAAQFLVEDLAKRYLNTEYFDQKDIDLFSEDITKGTFDKTDKADITEVLITEQSSDMPKKEMSVKVMAESGKLWLQPKGYGDKTSQDRYGWPIGLEIWQGRLRLVVFDDINSEEPKIIDLENARETTRSRCNWCDKQLDSEVVKWNSLLFCSNTCLDQCKAAQ